MAFSSKTTRRNLLKHSPLAGLGLVASATSVEAHEQDVPEDDDIRQPRLQDTDHIRAYYRLARS